MATPATIKATVMTAIHLTVVHLVVTAAKAAAVTELEQIEHAPEAMAHYNAFMDVVHKAEIALFKALEAQGYTPREIALELIITFKAMATNYQQGIDYNGPTH